MRSALLSLTTVSLLATVALPAGCPATSIPTDLPASLDHVRDNAGALRAAADNPLRNTTPGTLMDEIGTLDGCWGAYEQIDSTNSNSSLKVWQALRFNADTQTLTRYVAQDVASFVQVVFIQTGTYSISDNQQQLTFAISKIETSFSDGSIRDVTDRYEELPPYTATLTRDGDQLLAQFGLPADDPRTPAGFADDLPLIHTAFTCPTE